MSFQFMRLFLKSFVLFILLQACLFARVPLESVLPAIEKYMQTYHMEFQTPGAGIVVVKDGKVVYAKGFGTVGVDDKSEIDADTIFQLASVTKNFTAVLLTKLVSKGLLSWDDKVTKFFPDFQLSDPNITAELTVRDLMAQSSGLKSFAGDTLWHGRLSQEEVMDKMKFIPSTTKFREQYAYNNIFVGIAGLIIEKVTGKTYGQALHDELLEPIGMHDTSVGVEIMRRDPTLIDKIVGFFGGHAGRKHAKQHDLKEGKARTIPYYEEFYLFPGSSGVNATLNDLGKWLNFQLANGKVDDQVIIPEKDLLEMRKPGVDGTNDLYGQQFPKERINKAVLGLGCFIYDYGEGDNRVIVHSQMGGITGSRCLIAIMPEENLGIAIVGNLGGMRASLLPEAVLQKFLDLCLGVKDEIDWAKRIREKFVEVNQRIKSSYNQLRLENPRQPSPLESYVGKYENEIYGEAEIVLKDKQLWVHYRGSKCPLKHWNGDYFHFKGSEFSEGYLYDDFGLIEFGIDPSGKAYGLVINLLDEGRNPLFQRKS